MAGKTRTPRSKSAAEAEASAEDRAIDAALELIAAKGWRAVTMAEIAATAQLGRLECLALFPVKTALLDGFTRRIDRAVLSGVAPDEAETVRDRLFDLFMRRFDALRPHKKAVAALARGVACDPFAALGLGMSLHRSLAGLAEAAGVDTAGPLGRLRVAALAAIYLRILQVWLADDGADEAKTLAALDAALRRAEAAANSARFRPRTTG